MSHPKSDLEGIRQHNAIKLLYALVPIYSLYILLELLE